MKTEETTGKPLRKSEYLCYLVAFVPVAMFLLIMITLLSSPYLGLDFKRGGDGWILASADKKIHNNLLDPYIGKQMVSIAGREIQKDDLIKDLDEREDKFSTTKLMEPLKYFSTHIKKNEPVTIILKDNDSLSYLNIIPVGYPIFYYFSKSYILLILASMTLLLGLIVITKQSGDIRAVAFFVLTIVLSTHEIGLTMYAARPLSFSYEVFNFIYYFTSVLGYATIFAILYFALIFPKPLPIALNKYFIASLIILPPFIVIISSMIRLYVYPTIPIASLLLTILAILYSYFTISSPELRAQMRVILFGFITIAIIALGLYFIPMFLYNITYINIQGLMILSFIIPLSMAFAITKYKLMDIDTLFDNTLIYTLTIGSLVLLDIVIVYLLSTIKIPFLTFSTPILTLMAVWVVIFAYIPLRERLSYFVKRVLKREIYDIHKVSSTLSESFVSVNDEKMILSQVINAINDSLHPKKVEACIYNDKGCIDNEWKSECCLDTSELSTLPDKIFDGNAGSCKYPEGAIIIPVKSSEKPLGYFILYQKHSGRLYDSNDRKLISTILALAASAIERIRYREKDMKNVLEKANMSREIHDSVGNTFVQAILLSDTIRNSTQDTEVDIHAANLRKILSEGINDMRDLLWAVEQAESNVGELAYYLGSKLDSITSQPGIKFNMSTKLDDEDISIAPALKLNIIRIVQESVTNIIKHANATMVDIILHKRGGELLVSINDNGKGFDMEAMHAKSGSYGLRNIKKRCEDIGANLTIDSAPLKGTKINITLPIQK